MKLGIAADCRDCGKPVAISRVRGGAWMPFERQAIPAADDAVDAYLPRICGARLAMVPIGEVAPRHLEGVRWYAQRHRCGEYLRSKAEAYQAQLAKREHVASLGDSLEAALGPVLDQYDAAHPARLASGETT